MSNTINCPLKKVKKVGVIGQRFFLHNFNNIASFNSNNYSNVTCNSLVFVITYLSTHLLNKLSFPTEVSLEQNTQPKDISNVYTNLCCYIPNCRWISKWLELDNPCKLEKCVVDRMQISNASTIEVYAAKQHTFEW